ncbi:hypothetical protein ABIF35_006566 [Bradyrhizobium japonicum]|uniref:hypothetical protein n=1 Tax=Bradyrhizobium diazoefficiens TaxID=1355477 RepID=UPI00349B77B8
MSEDDVDESGRSDEFTYSDADAALADILGEAHDRALSRVFNWSPDGQRAPVHWRAAAATIASDSGNLHLDAESFWQLNRALDSTPDTEAADKIRLISHVWADTNWQMIESSAREIALDLFCKSSYVFSREFGAFVDSLPRLRGDRQLLESALDSFERGVLNPDAAVGQLRVLGGDQVAAARVVGAVTSRSGFSECDDLASLIAEWAGATIWGQLQYLLWRRGTEERRPQTDLEDLADAVVRAAELLKELGLTISGSQSYRLSELSAETRASWRHELCTVVGDAAMLKSAVTEILLWFGRPRDDRAVIFAVLDLHASQELAAIVPFTTHRNDLVRRRAVAVLDLANGVPNADALLRRRAGLKPAAGSEPRDGLGPSRTWIGDARIERLMEDALDAVTRTFGDQVRRTRDSGEETHVAILFERLAGAFSMISDRLAAYAAETNANERLEFKIEHRIVGKAEEGGKGIGADRFSADICVIFEAREDGRPFTRRASLVQAKRIFVRQAALEVDYYPVDPGQLRDLADQTMAGFVLLVGPSCDGVSMPVIPARLFLDLVERGEPSTQIAPAVASRLGKGLGTWLVEDVIGLWTGDWKEQLLAKAKGGEGREPFLLVEIMADRVRRGPDGWTH